MSLRHYSGSFFWPVVIIALIAIALAVAVIEMFAFVISAKAADNDTPCLTKAQAQAKFPGQWIYWHTANRCWDNVSVRSAHARSVAAAVKSKSATWGKQNSLKLPKPDPDPNGNITHHSGRPIIVDPPQQPTGPSIFYPSLMAGGGTDDLMLRSDSMTGWPALMDVDEPPQFIPWNERINLTINQ